MADLYRLTRAFFDSKGVLHAKGSELLFNKKDAPSSAKKLGADEKADLKANEETADPELNEPDIDITDVKAGDTLSSITKKASK